MKKEIGGNILKFLFFLACSYGIVRVSIWSYFQTQGFFIPFDGTSNTTTVSHGLALVSQYGQNVVLFLAVIEAGRRLAYKNKIESGISVTHASILNEEITKSGRASFLYYTLFGLFAVVDAGTNMGQFEITTLAMAKLTLDGFALTSFTWVGRLLSIMVVFIEELFMDTINALLHALNDVLESAGLNRFQPLDLFVDPDKVIATRLSGYNNQNNSTKYGIKSAYKAKHRPVYTSPPVLDDEDDDDTLSFKIRS